MGSVEVLKDWQEQDHTSLGIVKPKKILDVKAEIVGASEKAKFMGAYDEALRQMELPVDPDTGREITPLTPADYRFSYAFECDDSRCKGDAMSVLDWEVDASYSRMKKKHKSDTTAARLIVEELRKRAGANYNLRFFLGNIHNYLKTFTIVGLWYPLRSAQTNLFKGDEVADE